MRNAIQILTLIMALLSFGFGFVNGVMHKEWAHGYFDILLSYGLCKLYKHW